MCLMCNGPNGLVVHGGPNWPGARQAKGLGTPRAESNAGMLNMLGVWQAERARCPELEMGRKGHIEGRATPPLTLPNSSHYFSQ